MANNTPNILGIRSVFNAPAYPSQQEFYLSATAGTFTIVFVNGLHRVDYNLDGSTLRFFEPLSVEGGERVVVYSGHGGTFIPQEYLESRLGEKVDLEDYLVEIDQKIGTAGGQMTGHLVLSGDPTDPLHPATRQYVDALFDLSLVQDMLESALAGRATQDYVDDALGSKMNASALGITVASLDALGKLHTWQLPDELLKGERTFTRIGTLTVGISNWSGTWFPRLAGNITNIIATVDTPPTGAGVKLDIMKNEVGQLPEPKVVIDPTENIAIVDLSPESSIAFTEGDTLSISIDQVGSTEPGRNLNVQLSYQYG
jgi:hypothetical protein